LILFDRYTEKLWFKIMRIQKENISATDKKKIISEKFLFMAYIKNNFLGMVKEVF
jgi:hypothetical protein